jgi:tetratricopeptide (TPR) repeat protein
MNDIPVVRRFALAITAIVASGYLLRPQISEALVVRGDERLYRGNTYDALDYYRRAIAADPNDGSAVDRFLFGAVSLRDGTVVREGLALSSEYLRRRSNDDAVRMDRAMAFRLLGQWRPAADDFERVGERERDATAFTFAGYSALAAHDRSRAIAMWRRALAIDSRFVAARHALKRRGVER